jgi:hypothetical protein
MAIAAQLLAGTANVTIDGVAYMLAGDLAWSPNTVKQESQTGMDGYHGVKQTPVPGYMEFTLRDSSAISVGFFDGLIGVAVVAQLASGKIVIGRNMSVIDVQEVNSTEATFKVRFEGPLVEEA